MSWNELLGEHTVGKDYAMILKIVTQLQGIVLVRHGRTALNGNDTKQSKDSIRGWLDVPLSSEGLDQVQELGKALKGKGIEGIYTSNLRRAVQTAEAIQKETGAPIVEKSVDFRPWNLGGFQGKETTQVLPQLEPYILIDRNVPVPGGESFNSFSNRFLNALRQHMDQYERDHKTIAIVTHYRDVRLAEAWLSTLGSGVELDHASLLKDTIPPGTALLLTLRHPGRWSVEKIGLNS